MIRQRERVVDELAVRNKELDAKYLGKVEEVERARV